MFVEVSDMSTLIFEGSGFPDSAGTIDDVVVADIAPIAFFHVKALDMLQA